MEDTNKKPTYEIIKELSFLEQEIDLKIMKYNILRDELIKRFPFLEDDEIFKEKNQFYKNKNK